MVMWRISQKMAMIVLKLSAMKKLEKGKNQLAKIRKPKTTMASIKDKDLI